MSNIYLDNAAATPLDPNISKAMEPWILELYGNPSSIHQEGTQAKHAIDAARKTVATFLGSRPSEIIFVSGGTESDNLAILGAARQYRENGNHIVTTAIEHHAVLRAMDQLEKEGFEITRVLPNEQGVVEAKAVLAAIRPETILVSVMMANSETGMIQPVSDIGNAIEKLRFSEKKETPVFHTDACQGTVFLDLDVKKLHVDLLTINGSKAYGPKGVGVLFVKSTISLTPLMFGGPQEQGLRPGTENVAGIVGLGKALVLLEKKKKAAEEISMLRDTLATQLAERFPAMLINGDTPAALPGHLNISLPGLDGETVVLYLDEKGIRVSTGSACSSEEIEPSHVLLAMGRTEEEARGSIRFSLGKTTTKKEIKTVVEELEKIVEKLSNV